MKPKSSPLEELDAPRFAGAGFVCVVFDARLLNRSAPPVDPGEVTLDAATGGDLAPPNPVRPAKMSLDGDCGFCSGGEVAEVGFEGNVSPLKASIRLFTFECPEVVPMEDV